MVQKIFWFEKFSYKGSYEIKITQSKVFWEKNITIIGYKMQKYYICYAYKTMYKDCFIQLYLLYKRTGKNVFANILLTSTPGV